MKKRTKALRRALSLAVALLLAAALLTGFSSCNGADAVQEPEGPFPVIIVPGITGTELVCDGRTVWPTQIDGGLGGIARAIKDFTALRLNENAESDGKVTPVRISPMSARNNEDVGAANTYEALALTLSAAFGEDMVYFFGYDWRLSNTDNAEELSEYIAAVFKETGAARVNIVAHSMGGLVTGAYLFAHKGEKLVDTVVTCGTPFSGSQSAYNSLVRGGIANLIPSDVSVFDSFPSLYELMPLAALEKAGVTDKDGALKQSASEAQKKAFNFHENVTKKLSDVWYGVKHINVIGEGSDTVGEKGTQTGDGTVTVYSATADGLFDDCTVRFSDSHTGIVTSRKPLVRIADALGADKGE